MLNNPADVLSVVLRGTLGRSGRKRARRATKFLTGHGGFLSASTMIAAAGVAWGIYDTLKNQNTPMAAWRFHGSRGFHGSTGFGSTSSGGSSRSNGSNGADHARGL